MQVRGVSSCLLTSFPSSPPPPPPGMLNPLDCPHHMRQDEVSPFREGVVLQSGDAHSLVNCGLQKVECMLPHHVIPAPIDPVGMYINHVPSHSPCSQHHVHTNTDNLLSPFISSPSLLPLLSISLSLSVSIASEGRQEAGSWCEGDSGHSANQIDKLAFFETLWACDSMPPVCHCRVEGACCVPLCPPHPTRPILGLQDKDGRHILSRLHTVTI